MTEKEYQALHRKQMYDQIQRLRNEEHPSILRIADKLGINFRTVKRYLEMSRSEFESFSDNITNKPQILTPYTDFVVERLSLYQDTSTAQMHDWLKEAYADFPKVTQRTVYSFVMKVRQDYNLPRIATNERQYNPMPDTPPGKYAWKSVRRCIAGIGENLTRRRRYNRLNYNNTATNNDNAARLHFIDQVQKTICAFLISPSAGCLD